MDRSIFRPVIAIIGLVFVGGIAPGCAASWETNRVPFYLYGSPLISGSSDSTESRTDRRTESSEKTRYSLDESGHARPVDENRTEPGSSKNEVDDTNGEGESLPAQSKVPSSLKHAGEASPVSREPDRNADLDYVTGTMRANRVTLPEEATSSFAGLYKHCREEGEVFRDGSPAPGDIVFFHNTADANDDGRNNDWYTHGAVVVTVDGKSVQMLGYRGGDVRNISMNRTEASTHTSGSEVINSQLRPVRSSDPPYTQYLAGQLFAGYCSLLGDRTNAVIMENWKPGMQVQPPKR